MIISGNNISLELFNKQDINSDYINWLNDKDVVRFSRQRHKEHSFSTCLQYYDSLKKNKDYFLKIIFNKTNKFIGTMTYIIDFDCVDIGILIGDKNYWGKQIGYEAWNLSIRYLFSLQKINRITAGCLTENIAMKKIMHKSNMVLVNNKTVFDKDNNIHEEFVYYEIFKQK
ncbi:GNAT family N-acetyltransferase [Pelagibacteraceae bacterium]|nr:GNAT family N-acetyltransferase [Pelagibacteraceae bacterium]